MAIQRHNLQVARSATYSTLNTLSKSTNYIWIVLHGYGQQAEKVIQKFSFLPNDHFVIAPEGLNKFYWHTNNEPVACWMTKANRYNEINDFTNYLQSLYAIHCNHINQNTKIVFFGFSQGCATLWRWIHAKQPRYDHLINWAGWIPEDINYRHLISYFHDKKHYLVYSTSDKYIDDTTIIGINEVINQNKLELVQWQFEGGHRIPSEELQRFVTENITASFLTE